MTSVAFADGLPPNNVGNFNNFDLEQHPTPAGQSQPDHALGGRHAPTTCARSA